MFGHRQKLDVGKAHVEHVVHEFLGELAIGQRAIAFIRVTTPRPEVYLVDTDWTIHGRLGRARVHPRVVLPGVAALVNDGRVSGWRLVRLRQGIALQG